MFCECRFHNAWIYPNCQLVILPRQQVKFYAHVFSMSKSWAKGFEFQTPRCISLNLVRSLYFECVCPAITKGTTLAKFNIRLTTYRPPKKLQGWLTSWFHLHQRNQYSIHIHSTALGMKEKFGTFSLAPSSFFRNLLPGTIALQKKPLTADAPLAATKRMFV